MKRECRRNLTAHSLATGHHRSIARWHPNPQQEELSRLWRRLDGKLQTGDHGNPYMEVYDATVLH